MRVNIAPIKVAMETISAAITSGAISSSNCTLS
jgi:hypothetical protein